MQRYPGNPQPVTTLLELRRPIPGAHRAKIRKQRSRRRTAHNESECQPHFNLSLARVYLNGADPKLATRTWQDVMDDIVAKKKDETLRRWETAIKDKNFDCIRKLSVCETRPEHLPV